MSDLLVIGAAALVGYLVSETAHNRRPVVAAFGFFLIGAITASVGWAAWLA